MNVDIYREPFRHKGYAPLYISYSISRLGDWIYLIGFSLWLLDLTGSASLMALVMAAQTVPRVLLGAITGTIADRVNRAKLMSLCDLLQSILIFPLILVHTKLDLPIVFLVAFCLSLLSAQASVAKGPLIATILPRHVVVKGNALINATESIIMLVGPALGAWAVSAVGFHLTFVINAASFLLSAVLLQMLWKRSPAEAPTDPNGAVQDSFGTAVSGFFQAIRTRGLLRQLLVVVGLLAMGQGAVQALHTPLLMQTFHLNRNQYAAILAVQGLGGIVGSYLIMRLSERRSPKVLLSVGLLLASVTTGLLVTYPSFWMVCGLTFAEGVFFTGVFVAIPSLVQQSVSHNTMGRAFAALDATENGLMLLSMTASGLLVSFTPIRILFLGVSGAFVFGSWVAYRTLHEHVPLLADEAT